MVSKKELLDRLQYELGQCEKYGDPYGHISLLNDSIKYIKSVGKSHGNNSTKKKVRKNKLS